MKDCLKIVGLGTFILTSVAFASSPLYGPFWSVDIGYALAFGLRTQGNMELTTLDNNFFIHHEDVSYRRGSIPRLTFGYCYSSWFSWLVSAQHSQFRVVANSRQTAADGTFEDMVLTSDLRVDTIALKGLFSFAKGSTLESVRIIPFIDFGVGVSFWKHFGRPSYFTDARFVPASGKNISYMIGLGVNNQINHRFSFKYGVEAVQLINYESSHLIYSNWGWNVRVKQPISASVWTISPYLGLSYAL